MKTTSIEKTAKMKRFFELRKQEKELTAEISDLREYFKGIVTDGLLEAGDLVLMIELRSRTSIDRDLLKQDIGDAIKKYEKTTQYEQISIKEKRAA